MLVSRKSVLTIQQREVLETYVNRAKLCLSCKASLEKVLTVSTETSDWRCVRTQGACKKKKGW